MILAIVEDTKSEAVSQALLEAEFRVTKLATTGGFLRGGATTLMVGAEAHVVDQALKIIREQVPASDDPDKTNATLFVLNVKSFNQV